MHRKRWRSIPAGLLAVLLIGGPFLHPLSAAEAPAKTSAQKEHVHKGKIVGRSNKAKTISIKVGEQVEMVKFDDGTTGLQHAQPGEAAIIDFERRGGDRMATTIKPKLAKLPLGVVEMQPDELAALLKQSPEKGNYVLIDSRPANRYAQGHIPNAISVPVPKLKKTGSAYLPGDAKIKNTLLVFYCGGPT
jgi:hypothetical protein